MEKFKILGLYKNLIKLSKRIPDSLKKEQTLKKIRKTFKKNSKELDAIKIKEQYEKGYSQIAYLKMITPRDISEKISGTYIISEDGKFTNYEAENVSPSSRNTVNNYYQNGRDIDPDHLKRHQYLMRRMQFKEDPIEKPKEVKVTFSDL